MQILPKIIEARMSLSVCIAVESFVVTSFSQTLLSDFYPLKTDIKDLKDFQGVNMHVLAIDAAFVISEYHIKQAVAKAYNNLCNNCLKSKNLYNDIMYYMHIPGKIQDCVELSRIKEDTKRISFIFISEKELPTTAQIKEYAEKYEIVGEKLSLNEKSVDEHLMKYIIDNYKISSEELAVSSLDNCVSTRLALKDVVK